MSYLVDITVVGYVSDPALRHIAEFEYTNNGIVYKTPLSRIDTSRATGNKVHTTMVYAGSYDHLPAYEFIEHLAKLDWPIPDSVVVTVKGEDYFIIWTPKGWDKMPDPYDMRGQTVHIVGGKEKSCNDHAATSFKVKTRGDKVILEMFNNDGSMVAKADLWPNAASSIAESLTLHAQRVNSED